MIKKLLNYFNKNSEVDKVDNTELTFEEDAYYYKNATKNNTSYYLRNKNL